MLMILRLKTVSLDGKVHQRIEMDGFAISHFGNINIACFGLSKNTKNQQTQQEMDFP